MKKFIWELDPRTTNIELPMLEAAMWRKNVENLYKTNFIVMNYLVINCLNCFKLVSKDNKNIWILLIFYYFSFTLFITFYKMKEEKLVKSDDLNLFCRITTTCCNCYGTRCVLVSSIFTESRRLLALCQTKMSLVNDYYLDIKNEIKERKTG